MPPIIKRIVIFGATGNTGLATVETAIKMGYEVTVFVRDRNKLPENIAPKNVIVGDVLNTNDVENAVKDQDGVIIVLGTRNDLSDTTMMSRGTQNIVDAMKKYNVKRVAGTLSSFLFWDRSKVPERLLPLTLDHERMFNVLKNSDREWIAVCPPHIEDADARGGYTLRLDQAVGRSISKYDLAEILINSLSDDEKIGHQIGMGYLAA